ncbi:Kelch repeat and BTB domain-containing protein 12, partial [Xenoophorus captivus]
GIGCEGMDRGQSRHCLNAVEIYNPDGDYWRDGPPLPCPQLSLRTNASNAGVVGGKIYVCGYYKGAGTGITFTLTFENLFQDATKFLCLSSPPSQIVMMT